MATDQEKQLVEDLRQQANQTDAFWKGLAKRQQERQERQAK